ncbi:MAG: co-chaperone GroES [Minisyncoccia bacterium]
MAKTKIIPLADRVVVSVVTEKKTLSGIIISEGIGKERPERGVVTAVGKGRKNDSGEYMPVEVGVGDEVLFSKFGPEIIVVDGVEYYILREDQILAIIK